MANIILPDCDYCKKPVIRGRIHRCNSITVNVPQEDKNISIEILTGLYKDETLSEIGRKEKVEHPIGKIIGFHFGDQLMPLFKEVMSNK